MHNNEDDISLDQVLNTGTGADYTPVPDNTGGTPPADTPPAPADTPPAPQPRATDDGNADEDGNNSDNLKHLLSTFGNEEGLTEENIEVRKELLAKYGGHTFDQHGNIIDDKGEIHKSFDDLLAFTESEDTTTLDDNGNQIDEDGKIIKTALDIAREDTVINKLHEQSGYEFMDESGNIKIYSDDEDGFKELTDDMSAQRFGEWRTSFFNQTPELASVAKHLLSGGTIESYHSPTDYSAVDVTKLSDGDKERFIRRSLETKNMGKERIDSLITLFKDSALLDREALVALDDLTQYDASMKTELDERYNQAEAQREADNEAYWDGVEKVVSQGDLGDIKIPANEKQGFFDYLSMVVDDKGTTKEMVDRSNETTEQQLTFAYLRYKGYDINQLVKSKVTMSKAKSLKDMLKRGAKLKQNVADTSTGTGKSAGDVTISDLLG
jgi:hypothetical protein